MSLESVPTEVNPRLIFTFNKSNLPNYTGNYTFIIREVTPSPDPNIGTTWIKADEKWSVYQATWDEPAEDTWKVVDELWSEYPKRWIGSIAPAFSTIETDRAWIEGNDVPTFTEYNVPSTPGQYSIYHN
jgi:hypothetical protein